MYPLNELKQYAQGHLGIMDKTYYRAYLLSAYRSLNGQPFNEAETDALADAYSDQTPSYETPGSSA